MVARSRMARAVARCSPGVYLHPVTSGRRAQVTCSLGTSPTAHRTRETRYAGLEAYLRGGPDATWREMAPAVGFLEPDEDDFDDAVFRLRQVLAFAGITGVAQLNELLDGARPWASAPSRRFCKSSVARVLSRRRCRRT
jgi:hypothetical protein